MNTGMPASLLLLLLSVETVMLQFEFVKFEGVGRKMKCPQTFKRL